MLNYSLLYPINNEKRNSIRLDGMWRFKIDFEGGSDYSKGLCDYDYIPVPASFQDFYTDKRIREFAGNVWYENMVFVPSYMKGDKVYIRFSAATHRAKVYLNGEEVFENEGGFLPFLVDITDKARYGEENQLVVMVNNELTETNIPCGRTITLKNGAKMNKPYFDFYNYSGLQRSVYLISVPKSEIFDINLSYKVFDKKAEITYSIITKGIGEINLTLLDGDGNIASKADCCEGVINLDNPHLWDVGSPYLYKLIVEFKDGKRIK